jgi:DNA-binding LacI/PurR family transcriptional regulator
MSSRPPTLYDVAAAAGVSHQTVSRVVNDLAGVSEATRNRVRAVMKELGYSPNQLARRLAVGGEIHRVIGVLAHEMYATGPAAIFKAAFDVLQQAGYQLDVAYVAGRGDDTDSADAIRERLAQMNRECVGILAMPQSDEVRQLVVNANLTKPVFIDEMLDRGSPARPGTEELVGRAAAAHLVGLGHTRIGHLRGPVHSLPADFRQASLAESLCASGLELAWVYEGDWSMESGYAAGTTFDEHNCTAVVASNDEMAIGFLSALRDRGIEVPGQVSVLGIDDIPQARFVDPPLSSIVHDFEGEGQLAALTLMADIEGRPRPRAEDYIRVRTVERASTSKPRVRAST